MSDTDSLPDKKEIFKNMLKRAWEDGVETKDELLLLKSLKAALNINDEEYRAIREDMIEKIDVPWLFFLEDDSSDEARGVFELDEDYKPMSKYEVYRDVLAQVLADDVVTEDELYFLASLRSILGIDGESHREIDAALRRKFEESDEVIKKLEMINNIKA